MDIRSSFAGAERLDLKATDNIVNPTNNKPKFFYWDIFLALNNYRDHVRGGYAANQTPCYFLREAGGIASNAILRNGSSWSFLAEGTMLMPKFSTAGFILVIAVLIEKLQTSFPTITDEEKNLLREWAGFLEFCETNVSRTDRVTIASFIGHCETLDKLIGDWLAQSPFGAEEVIFLTDPDDLIETPNATDMIGMTLYPAELFARLDGGGAQINDIEEESERLGLVTHLAASMTANLLLIGPPGTGKTYMVQRSITNIPFVQVSLEGSTDPETVVATIAQTPEGKFQAFMAETGRALKLGMLLAIVERLREGRRLSIKEEEEVNLSSVLSVLPKNSLIGSLFPKSSKKSKVSEDLILILDSISASFDDEPTLRAWMAVLDAYADPFVLDRWDEILFVYNNLEAHGVGTTCVLNVEEIYHAVENRKILDLLINLMAGQKKLPLSKAGVVGGELYGHNVSVFATGNPLSDAYLPAALESRFGIKEFLGYPDDEEEKRRMKNSIENYQNPQALSTNLLSTRLEDFPKSAPLPRKLLTAITDELRDKIYNLVQWTRSMYSSQDLRNCADPRMSMMWELLTSAFIAEGKSEKMALLLAVKSTAIGLVSIDHQGEPDQEGLKNIFQQAESYFLD